MDKNTLKGDWNILKGKIKEKWGKFTENDLTEINGKRDQLLGKLQRSYGYAKERAEKELSEWEHACDKECKAHKDKHPGSDQEHAISGKHSHKH